MAPPSGAAFLVAGTPPSAGGYDTTSAAAVALQLQASPALDVTSCVYSVIASSPGAPAPTFSNGGVASPPTAVVTMTMPTVASTAAHTYQIQCQTNNGAAVMGPTGKLDDYSVNTTTRVVVIRNSRGLRKMFVGESTEYDADGWVEVVDAVVDATGAVAPNLTTTTLTLGDQTPPQFAAAAVQTVAIVSGGPTQILAAIPIPVGRPVSFELSVNAWIALPVPGIVLPGYFDAFIELVSYGSSNPVWLNQGSGIDTLRTTTTSPWVGSVVTPTPSGSNGNIVASGYTPPAFSSGATYGGAIKSPTTLPNAVGDPACALVTNGGHIYVCTVGGTDSSSGGPTGTGLTAIVVGGLTWYYVGPAASGVTVNITVALDAVKTG